jgi:hypothetical protein
MIIELNTLSLSQLASLYNLIAEKPITKFKDKATGVAKLSKLLEETQQEVFIAEGEHDIRPIVTEEPVAPMVQKTEKTTKRRGRKSSLTGKKITLVREKNPKREKSRTAVRYEVYREAECKTSDDFIRICEERKLGTRREILSDLDYDSKQEFIRLS